MEHKSTMILREIFAEKLISEALDWVKKMNPDRPELVQACEEYAGSHPDQNITPPQLVEEGRRILNPEDYDPNASIIDQPFTSE